MAKLKKSVHMIEKLETKLLVLVTIPKDIVGQSRALWLISTICYFVYHSEIVSQHDA